LTAIRKIRRKEVAPARFHDDVKQYYSWVNVAERTEKVYDVIYPQPEPPLIERFRRYYGCGVFAGKIFCFVIALDYLLWMFLEWWFPREDIEIAPSFPYKKYRKLQQSNETMDVT
jgi:phosphatidylinositol glycan class A protein